MDRDSSALIPAERRHRIREMLRAQGTVKVSALSQLFDVSEITIRRDLEHLERDGLLERTHGGAVLSQRMRREPLYTDKDQLHRAEKQTIGRVAATLVDDGDTLLVNSGSTTLQVIRHLAGRQDVRVITSNMGGPFAIHDPGFEVILVGGTFRSQSNSLVGPLATQSLRQVYGSKAFIGVDGISLKYGLTTPTLPEAEVARTMIERTRGPVIVVADHTKLGVVADFVTTSLDQVDVLVMDRGFDEAYREALEELNIQIVIAE
ncbi:MAG: DeoR/GlpR family DNA-binding transcription regulator [Anaerolineae bacterium]